MADRKFGFETLCLHAGQIPDAVTGARAAPIYQTTSFVFDSADHAASLFNLQTFGNVYSRISNPTVAVFEERMAAIENGRAALACATGQAAEATAILTLCKGGDHIVSASTLYGGTHTLLGVNLHKLGIETTFIHPDNPENFSKAIKPNTKLLYAETLGNPLINIVDLEALSKIARAHDIPLVVDNTVPSPYLCRPFDWGADIVVHSATKYIGGHGTTMGGVILEPGKVDWAHGASGLLHFGVQGGAKAGERFIEAAEFMSHLANIGDAKTLVIHPASTTHRQMSDEEQLKAGVKPDMVRMSVGIESLDDILWDIDQALNESGKA